MRKVFAIERGISARALALFEEDEQGRYTPDTLKFTGSSLAVLANAYRLAEQLKNTHVCTQHVLLAMTSLPHAQYLFEVVEDDAIPEEVDVDGIRSMCMQHVARFPRTVELPVANMLTMSAGLSDWIERASLVAGQREAENRHVEPLDFMRALDTSPEFMRALKTNRELEDLELILGLLGAPRQHTGLDTLPEQIQQARNLIAKQLRETKEAIDLVRKQDVPDIKSAIQAGGQRVETVALQNEQFHQRTHTVVTGVNDALTDIRANIDDGFATTADQMTIILNAIKKIPTGGDDPLDGARDPIGRELNIQAAALAVAVAVSLGGIFGYVVSY